AVPTRAACTGRTTPRSPRRSARWSRACWPAARIRRPPRPRPPGRSSRFCPNRSVVSVGVVRSADRRAERTARRPRLGALAPYLFVLPAILYLGALLVYPIVINVLTSFQQLTALNLISGDADWVGSANYGSALHDPAVVSAAVHSVEYTAVAVVV